MHIHNYMYVTTNNDKGAHEFQIEQGEIDI